MNILNNKKIGLIGIIFLMFFGISNLAFAQEQLMNRTVEEEQNQKFTNLSTQLPVIK